MKTRHICDGEREEIAVGKITCLIVLAVFVLSVFVWGCKTPDLPDIDIPDIITPTTTTIPPVVTTTTQPPNEVEPTGKNYLVPELYAPKYSVDGAVEKKPNGGFVWNPVTGHNKIKVVLPEKYLNKIAWVTIFTPDGSWKNKPDHEKNNEEGNRARFYGPNIADVPIEVYVRAHIVEDGQANDFFVKIQNTREKWR